MKIKLLSLALVALVTFASCKKDDPTPVAPTPVAPSLVGFWKGKYGSGATSYPTSGYCFLYRTGGTVRVFDGADTTAAAKAEGTYAINGNKVTTTYTYTPGGGTFSISATVDAKFTFIEGTWGSGTNVTNGGNYFVNKQ